jgi:hypothetical protein
MKSILYTIAFLLVSSMIGNSQESFKKSLEVISTDLCSKISEKGKKKIVVLFVTDISKSPSALGKHIADVVSFYAVNNKSGFSVFDRENLSGITEAKKLIAEGYIDVNNTKQLGKLLAVEAILVGNYTVLANTVSLTLKALDVNDGFVIAQSLIELPIDKDAGALLGVSSMVGQDENMLNKGFNNRPLNSNESYNNSKTVDKNCETTESGDYCFTNLSDDVVLIEHLKTGRPDFTLKPKETQCIYNIRSGSYEYYIRDMNSVIKAKGSFLVEKCKSKTFTIKKENKQETKLSKCEENSLGDYCFQNNRNKNIRIIVSSSKGCSNCAMRTPSIFEELTLTPGQMQCVYDLKENIYYYFVSEDGSHPFWDGRATMKGQIIIEKCTSKTFIIK